MGTPIGVVGFAGHGKDTLADILVHEYGYTKIAFATKLKSLCADLLDLTHEQMNDPVLKETYLCDHPFPFRNRSEFRARIPGALSRLVEGNEADYVAAAAGEDTGAFDHVASGLTVLNLYRQASDRIALYIEPLIFFGMLPTLAPTPRYLLQVMGTEVFRAIHPRFWTRLWKAQAELAGGRVVAPDARFMQEIDTVWSMNGACLRVTAYERLGHPDMRRMHMSETAVAKLVLATITNDGTMADFREAVRVWAELIPSLRAPAA